jgi:hypothetical protein
LEDKESHSNNAPKKTGVDPRMKLPVVGAPNSTVAHYLSSHRMDEVYELDKNYQRPCLIFPRWLYGAFDSDSNTAKLNVPQGFNVSNFNTLRYRKQGKFQAGKAIVNVAAYDPDRNWVDNPHKPYKKKLCSWNSIWSRKDAIFRVNHYTGSLQAFLSGRPDRTAEQFHARNIIDGKEKYETVGWLDSFANQLGHKLAYDLTEGLRAWAFASDADAFSPKVEHVGSENEKRCCY